MEKEEKWLIGSVSAIMMAVVLAAVIHSLQVPEEPEEPEEPSEPQEPALEPDEPTEGLANLYGAVYEYVTGAGIVGALVALDGDSVYTDSSGHYIFSDIQPGDYLISFTKTGHQTASANVTIVGGNNVLNAALTLIVPEEPPVPEPEPPQAGLANLYGLVYDSESGGVFEGVVVTLNGDSVSTTSSGYYEFLGIEPGMHTISFEKAGYTTLVYAVDIAQGNNELNATLASEGLYISLDHPHHTRTWAWKPTLYDINTGEWQPPPSLYNDIGVPIMFRPTGSNFLLYVREFYRDIDGTGYTSYYGPQLFEAPKILRGSYAWTGSKLVGEYTITAKGITGTGHNCNVTAIMNSVSHTRGSRSVKGVFTVEEINSISGLGAAQYFVNNIFIPYHIRDATARDGERCLLSPGMRIVMDLYLMERFRWVGHNVHLPYEYPPEQYSFSGGAVKGEWMPTHRWVYTVNVSSPYLSSFGVMIVWYDWSDDDIQRVERLVGPVTNHEFIITEGTHYFVLAHPNPGHSFSTDWSKEDWELRNWRQIAFGKCR